MQLKPGTTLQNGKYEIVKTLGQGGFGITYQAEQVALNRKVAIKEFFMKDICIWDDATDKVSVPSVGKRELVDRFHALFVGEARTVAALNHPNIVKIIDIFEEKGTAYYVELFMEGGSLAELCKDGRRLSESEALRYTRQIASALDYLHHRPEPMNHLNVKPSNVVLDENGDAVLIDFGIMKCNDGQRWQTSSTPVGISHGYSPLEQYKEGGVKEFSPATDIYSLGATLYKMVTGQTPPQANDIFESGLPVVPDVSPRLHHAIEAAMQPHRADRPQSISDFLKILDVETADIAEADGEGMVMKEPELDEGKMPDLLQNEEKRNSKTWLLVLLACAVVVAIVAAIVLSSRKRTTAPVEEPVPVEQPTTGTINGHDWVDLGLRSGLKWATCNVGASSPGDCGSYFAWGETSTKTEYTWETYKFRVLGNSEDNVTFNKYITQSFRGSVDNKKTLDLSDDAARANWGGTWRMPTQFEWNELILECKLTWTIQGGSFGFKVTSTTNGNSIFLPAAEYWEEFGGYEGNYWSSSLEPLSVCRAYCRSFSEGAWGIIYDNKCRYCGVSVRPVSE